MNIIVHTTKEQIQTLMDQVPFSYNEDGFQVRDIPTWMLILFYLSAESDGIDRLGAQVLYGEVII